MSDWDNYIETASELVGLKIDDAHRHGVRLFLSVAQEMAGLVEATPLEEDELALAPVYLLPERPL